MSVKVQNNTILKTGRRPEWRYPSDHATNPGEVITNDSIYRAGGIDPEPDAAGWYTISDENKPSYDSATEKPPQPKAISEWEIKSDRVVRTWDAPETKTVAERQNQLSSQAESQYNTVLRNGFDDGTGTVWPATNDARSRILDLTQHIQEFRAGTMSTELPKGKTTIRLQDVTGAMHDADASKIIELADKGSDFKEDAQDRLEQLIGQIQAAASHADLDAISIDTGWPS
mgnify:CR=1 FL=1